MYHCAVQNGDAELLQWCGLDSVRKLGAFQSPLGSDYKIFSFLIFLLISVGGLFAEDWQNLMLNKIKI